MSNELEVQANRRNARRSTGPKTPEGKAVVSLNAQKHGLASRTIVLPEENRREFQELLDGFRSQFQPQNPAEEFLVRQLAAADWRLRRSTRIETGLITDRLDDLRDDLELDGPKPDPADSDSDQQFDQDTSLMGCVFWHNSSATFATLLRYDHSIRRASYKALHDLRLVQARPASAPTSEPAPGSPGSPAPPARRPPRYPPTASLLSPSTKALALASITSVEAPRPMTLRPRSSSCTVTSPIASVPLVTARIS